jgi:hypothetical protein
MASLRLKAISLDTSRSAVILDALEWVRTKLGIVFGK